VRIGAVILFIGLIFLLNYAREHQMIAPEFRVAGVALVGIVLLVVGWRLRNSRTGYAVSLQGAGVAVLYLTIFASMRLYNLISHEAAFFLLAAMAAFSAIVAVGQNSLALAVIGAGGGFLAPILASTGSGNHVVLFGYYLVLNLGIVAIAWSKAWRVLNVVAFAFTFLIGLAWGERSYRPELFETTEPFLVAFFLLYLAVAILFARASSSAEASSSALPSDASSSAIPSDASSSAIPPGINGRGSRAFVDGTIVFGTPLAAFGLQAGIVKHIEYALAYSSLVAAAIYIVLATVLHRRGGERFRLLAESFLAMGVVFATLAIPLALDARWTSAAWALEGAAIVWIGVRQQRKLARAFGLLLQLGAGVAYLLAYQRMPAGVPLFDAPFIGALLVALAGLWTSRLLTTGGERVTKAETGLAPFAFVWGLLWLIFAGHHEIHTFLPRETRLNAHAAFFARHRPGLHVPRPLARLARSALAGIGAGARAVGRGDPRIQRAVPSARCIRLACLAVRIRRPRARAARPRCNRREAGIALGAACSDVPPRVRAGRVGNALGGGGGHRRRHRLVGGVGAPGSRDASPLRREQGAGHAGR
jgi:uncharacterized membrane protein